MMRGRLVVLKWRYRRGEMPLTEKGKKIKREMVKKYGAKKGKQVFFASERKGTIKGVAHKKR